MQRCCLANSGYRRRLVLCRFAVVGAPAIAAACGAMQPSMLFAWTDKVATTPNLIQDNFGPAGDEVPYDGLEYCFPTGLSMSITYLGINGFNQLAPSSPTPADEVNLVNVMGGLMGTVSTVGSTGTGVTEGITTYLAAKGIATSDYTLTYFSSPTVADLETLNTAQTVVDLGLGFYNPSAERVGGHCVTLVNQGVGITGSSAPNTVVVNNPEPSSVAPDPDIPARSLQYLNTVPTSGAFASDGAIELDPNQFPGYTGTTTTVVEDAIVLTVDSSQLSSSDPTPATWTLSTTQSLNLNGGSFSVLAPLAGAGGIDQGTGGVLQLQSSDTTTGDNIVDGGTVASSSTTSNPWGTGAMSLQSGQLEFDGTGSSKSLSIYVAGGSSNQLTFSGGSSLLLERNGEQFLTLTIGGNTGGSVPNIERLLGGTLEIMASDGTADLGASEKVIVNGSGGDLPALTNGIVEPSIVANDPNTGDGDFLTYGTNGFVTPTYATGGIASAGFSAVYEADTAQTLAASSAVQVYALKVEGVTVGGGASSILQVGNQTSGQGGVILNGGTISTPTLSFGASQGVIYASSAGGTISSVIEGSGGIVSFGPGSLVVSGANTYSGTTYVNGTLVAMNTSGSATGSSAVTVLPNGALEVSGASAQAGGTGGTLIETGGTLLLSGGTLAGSLTVDGNLQGQGTISGAVNLAALITGAGGPNKINFTGNVSADSATVYSWFLNSLDDTSADAGKQWSLLSFTNSSAQVNFGSSSSPVNWAVDFNSSIPDPNSGNPFWNSAHQWLALKTTTGYHYVYWSDDFPAFSQGYFSLSSNAAITQVYVDYTPYSSPLDANECTWGAAGGGNWSDSGSWKYGVIPQAVGDTASFTSAITTASIVAVDGGWTLGNMYFNSSQSYTLAAGIGGELTLANGVLNPSVTDAGGSHLISAPMVLESTTNFTVDYASDVLQITGSIFGPGGLSVGGNGSVSLGGVNSYQGSTAVTSGKLLVTAASAIPAGANISISGGTMQLASGVGGISAASLFISGGHLDLSNNHMFIDYGSGPDPIAFIKSWIISGYNGGAWNGSGIISTAAQSSSSYGIGYADSADPENPAGLASGTIEIAYTLLGDANLDGKVNGTDFAILASNFNQAVTSWDQGDFNYDGKVNGTDFAFLASNFNQGASQADIEALDAFAAAHGLMADVPEPGVAAFAGGAALLLRRRRRGG